MTYLQSYLHFGFLALSKILVQPFLGLFISVFTVIIIIIAVIMRQKSLRANIQ